MKPKSKAEIVIFEEYREWLSKDHIPEHIITEYREKLLGLKKRKQRKTQWQ